MRLFLDECLSPKIAQALNAEGIHVVLHPRDFGGLVSTQEVHPGLIILPSVGRERSEALLRDAIAFLSGRGDPMNVMVNHVLEVSIEAEMTLSTLPMQEQ